MLLDGLKFDFRVYVAVLEAGTDACKVYLFQEGLARFCTEPYAAPTPQNFHNVMSHLTNYSLNKRSDQFDHGAQGEAQLDTGTKRLLSAVVSELEERGLLSREDFHQELHAIVSGTFEALHPLLWDGAAQLLGAQVQDKSRCFFQLLGFDIILDDSGKAHLLEVNANPSLQLTTLTFDREDCKCMDSHRPHGHDICPVDEAVKTSVVADTLRLATCRHEVQGAFHAVLCGESSSLLRATKLFRHVAGRKMTGQRFRNFLAKTGLVSGSLGMHQADVMYLKWQHANSDGFGEPDSVSFCELLQSLAAERGEGLTQLMDMVVSSGYADL
eukprot:TRINITY_DN12301_c0_g1_i2.p1 TRINITY_DN12301_c0_g1~~TRINITY_DN12301_c0_g1_i2.p1  ORF type:complete len:327 (-),score=81.74 TRINITY_DN12301_c0_g1_i2:65-1045(-)